MASITVHCKIAWWFWVYAQTVACICGLMWKLGVWIEPDDKKIWYWFKKSVSFKPVKS
jgi:hypothetical protein